MAVSPSAVPVQNARGLTLVYFVTTKLIAATGFVYLFPNRPQLKGESFVVDLIGSIYLSERNLVAFKVFTSYAFFGNFRIPVWPALTHHLRIFSLSKQPVWVVAAVLVAARETIVLAYDGGCCGCRSPGTRTRRSPR